MTSYFSLKTIFRFAPAIAIALMPLSTKAGDYDEGKNAASYIGTSDKAGYTFFNPTPREMWRELSPDRPDVTESALTVDAGAYVIEASFFDWRQNGRDDTYTFMSTNFKVGLTNRIDLQTVFDTYAFEGGPSNADGFGDVQFRLKYNVWGNDGGSSAFAIFPFIKVPTGTELSNGQFEGGLILPFSMDLNDRVGLGLMAEIDYFYDEINNDYQVEFLHTIVLGFDLTERVGLYTEYIGIAGLSAYQTYAAGGMTLAVSEDLVFDCGTQIGLNADSEEIGAFCGFTKRF